MLNKYLLCASEGHGDFPLTSFDDALRNSHIANYNLVKVSSILPAGAMRQNGVDIIEGSVLHTAFAFKTSNEKGQLISAAVAIGIPEDTSKIGVIMEYSDCCTKEDAEQKIKEMVKEAMAKRGYKVKEILVKSHQVVCTSEGYSTAFAALAMWE
jgi:arginine decarboxylase